MRAFWASGYDGASVDVMCRVTHMSRASLYQTYGGKEGLFLATIAHYAETRVSRVAAALGPNGTLAEDLTSFYDEVVLLATQDPETPGCLISCVLADAAGTNEAFRMELDRRFLALEDRIAVRLGQAGWAEERQSFRRRRGWSCCRNGAGHHAAREIRPGERRSQDCRQTRQSWRWFSLSS